MEYGVLLVICILLAVCVAFVIVHLCHFFAMNQVYRKTMVVPNGIVIIHSGDTNTNERVVKVHSINI